MTFFGPGNAYQVALGPTPRTVESIINVVDVTKTKFVAGVSGGVSIDTNSLVASESMKTDD